MKGRVPHGFIGAQGHLMMIEGQQSRLLWCPQSPEIAEGSSLEDLHVYLQPVTRSGPVDTLRCNRSRSTSYFIVP
jgi:hypothetical protein